MTKRRKRQIDPCVGDDKKRRMKTFTTVVVVVCLFVLSGAITYSDEEPENLRDECKAHFDRTLYYSFECF